MCYNVHMVINYLEKKLKAMVDDREPDFLIHSDTGYIRRWHIIPKNRIFNIFLHKVAADDDDRALHDHPWYNCSVILDGCYREITPKGRFNRARGTVTFRRATALHRLEVENGPVWSLFFTGPKYRKWGFDAPEGWMDFLSYFEKYDKS